MMIPKPSRYCSSSSSSNDDNKLTIAKGKDKIFIYIDESDKELLAIVDCLAQYCCNFLHIDVAIVDNHHDDHSNNNSIEGIAISLRCNKGGAESYRMEVKEKGIFILGDSYSGVFYAVQSLIQLINANDDNDDDDDGSGIVKIDYCEIEDSPKYGYRGMMIDISRHFFDAKVLKSFIDVMALLKFNRLHLHLCDDQGWRIEVKQYPKLVEIGSKRAETRIAKTKPPTFDGVEYGPYYYSQQEMKEIIEYAKQRYITIIPEIEMPGHALAALASYPFLGCNPASGYSVARSWGIYSDVYCAGRETTFEFLFNVIDEMVALFPSKYFHIGGDECVKSKWEVCEDCQRRIKAENLKDEAELQSYFVKRIEKYLHEKHGRILIGWDEIIEGGLPDRAVVMSWRGSDGGLEAIQQQHPVIFTPNSHFYFDYYQSRDQANEPIAIGGYIPLQKVYEFDAITEINQLLSSSSSSSSANEYQANWNSYILGMQCNLWTEYIPNAKHLQYMAFPRAFAITEISWHTGSDSTPSSSTLSNKSVNFEDFVKRICHFKTTPLYKSLHINCYEGDVYSRL